MMSDSSSPNGYGGGGQHSRYFNNKTSSKTNVSAKPLVLAIGLMVVSVLDTFLREYATPNPHGRPDFHITDFEAYTPEGEKILIESPGDNRAAYYALSIR
jgi:hypothetical protein